MAKTMVLEVVTGQEVGRWPEAGRSGSPGPFHPNIVEVRQIFKTVGPLPVYV